jgi:calcineurin-like phosphoesterase family protein
MVFGKEQKCSTLTMVGDFVFVCGNFNEIDNMRKSFWVDSFKSRRRERKIMKTRHFPAFHDDEKPETYFDDICNKLSQ